jgi:ABC-type multidrug transport system ATPase subunit
LVSVSLNKLGKKFNREWIFRDLTYDITGGQKLVILGGNGSGKSTLLQVISGFITPNEGEITYSLKNNSSSNRIEFEKTRNYISFASPYLQLVEDFDLYEMIEHAATFKPFMKNLSAKQVSDILQLEKAGQKPIKQFSSGMKQRVKLGLAILADTPLLLLDEPVSNLDKNGIAWYKQLIADYGSDRTIIVCSNAISDEYFFCEKELNVMDYK